MQLVILLVMLLAATRLAELRLAIIQQQPMPRHRTTWYRLMKLDVCARLDKTLNDKRLVQLQHKMYNGTNMEGQWIQ